MNGRRVVGRRTLVVAVLCLCGLSLVLTCGAVAAQDGGGHHGGGDEGDHGSGTICPNDHPEWRAEQAIAGVAVAASQRCNPDSPSVVAASVKGTNNVPRDVLMRSRLGRDAVVKRNDSDGDGDPDEIHVTLEVTGVNERNESDATHEIAPGVKPSFWTFAPKTRGMVSEDSKAQRLIRMPSPTLRAEAGDKVFVHLENTHYLPHTIHLHGVDHPYETNESTNGSEASGSGPASSENASLGGGDDGNDGVPQTSEKPLLPGENRTYEFTPEQAGTMFYHCHVVPNAHVLMGLNGMFVVEEERANNSVQTLNVGAGKVRHPSKGVGENYTAEYDMAYQTVDKELHEIPQQYDDTRRIAKEINRGYDVTDSDPDYFLLNGKSFPYTVRESIVATERNESYRLRMLNTGTRPMSIHTHGHKFTTEAYDGIELDESQEIQRDVLSITTAQRVDLTLNTTVDGLNSYGEGLWLAHDHRESGVTTDGISPGGTVTMIAYEDYLDERGVPRTDTNLSRYFSEAYYDGEIPYWGRMDPEAFGEPPGSNGTAGGDGADESAANGSDTGGSSGHDHGSGNDDHGAGTGTGDGTATSDGANADGDMDMDGDGMNGSDTNASGNASGGMDMGGDGMDMGGDGMMGGGMMMDMSMVPNGTVINANPDELPPGCEAVSGERTVTVKGGEEWAAPGEAFAFSTEEFAFDRCERVTVTFENHDDVRHQWMVHGLPTETYPMGMFNLEARQQGSVTGTFITPAENGRLELHCSLPQHEQKGMHAAIAVGDGADGSGETGGGNETGEEGSHAHSHGDGASGSGEGTGSSADGSAGRAGVAGSEAMSAAVWGGIGLLVAALLAVVAVLIRR